MAGGEPESRGFPRQQRLKRSFLQAGIPSERTREYQSALHYEILIVIDKLARVLPPLRARAFLAVFPIPG